MNFSGPALHLSTAPFINIHRTLRVSAEVVACDDTAPVIAHPYTLVLIVFDGISLHEEVAAGGDQYTGVLVAGNCIVTHHTIPVLKAVNTRLLSLVDRITLNNGVCVCFYEHACLRIAGDVIIAYQSTGGANPQNGFTDGVTKVFESLWGPPFLNSDGVYSKPKFGFETPRGPRLGEMCKNSVFDRQNPSKIP